jgi:DNA-binding XRE family transcriptional regulator
MEETIIDRLIKARTELGLNQGKFAQKIGLSQAAVSDFENCKKSLIDRNIKLICLTFGVNEIWLRTGEGKMFMIYERVERLQKYLNMTPQEFADVIKSKTGKAFPGIEEGKNTLTEQNIAPLCTPNLFIQGKTVNYFWLKYGDKSEVAGEQPMFINSPHRPLDERLEKLKAEERELIELYDQLVPESQKEVVKYTRERLELQELRKGDISTEPNPIHKKNRA